MKLIYLNQYLQNNKLHYNLKEMKNTPEMIKEEMTQAQIDARIIELIGTMNKRQEEILDMIISFCDDNEQPTRE